MNDPRINFFFDKKIVVFSSVQELDGGRYTCKSSDGYVNPKAIVVEVQKPGKQYALIIYVNCRLGVGWWATVGAHFNRVFSY